MQYNTEKHKTPPRIDATYVCGNVFIFVHPNNKHTYTIHTKLTIHT